MRQVHPNCVTLQDDSNALNGGAVFNIPYFIADVLAADALQKVSAIRFLRSWWHDKHGTSLGLREAKDIVEWLLANPNYSK